MSDLDAPSLAADVRSTQRRLRNQFKATEATANADHDEVTFRLAFRGFADLDAALSKVSAVARRLEACPQVASVHAGTNTDGAYDPAAEAHDDRPSGWVNVTFGCTCASDEACDFCGGE